MGQQTAEQIKQEMIERLGKDFGILFYSLRNEIIWLTLRWIEYKELYGAKESGIELMNKAAPFFFFTVQKVFWENLILGIAKLTDPPQSRGRKNATLRAIPLYINDEPFKIELVNDINDLLVRSEFCRDWRNRWVAHLDHDLSTDRQNAEPLKTATRKQLRTAIETIQNLYNKISYRYFKSTTAFQHMTSSSGAISLLHRIEDGIRYDEKEYERKLKGDWVKEEFESKV